MDDACLHVPKSNALLAAGQNALSIPPVAFQCRNARSTITYMSATSGPPEPEPRLLAPCPARHLPIVNGCVRYRSYILDTAERYE